MPRHFGYALDVKDHTMAVTEVPTRLPDGPTLP